MKLKMSICLMIALVLTACGGAGLGASTKVVVAVKNEGAMRADSSSGPSAPPVKSNQAPAPQGNSVMKAGEIDDNALWADYLKYRDEHSNLTFHSVDVSERYVISVT